VTLTGTGIAPLAEVQVQGASATVVSVSVDGTQAVVVTPPNTAGAAAVQVINPDGQTGTALGAFLYEAPLAVTSISPTVGPIGGGTPVTIQGAGFDPTGGTTVAFGGKPALQVATQGVSTLTAYTPSGGQGTVDVTVTNPDGTTAIFPQAFTFQQPEAASIAATGAVHDLIAIGNTAYLATSAGLQVVDLSGLYRTSLDGGLLPIPPSLAGGVIPCVTNDPTCQYGDQRILAELDLGEAWSISYPPQGGTLIYLSTVVRGATDGGSQPTGGQIVQVDISTPSSPVQVSLGAESVDGIWQVNAAGDRALGAAGADGLAPFDISNAPFPLIAYPTSPGAQALAVSGGLLVLGQGVRNGDGSVGQGTLNTYEIDGNPEPLGSLTLNVQRVQIQGTLAAVAAGDAGLVLVDISDPRNPVITGQVAVGGFAWDVALDGTLAYVAAGAEGIAVVDIAQPQSPVWIYTVSSGAAGQDTAVALAGSQLLGGRSNGYGGSVDFGLPSALQVIGASLTPGQLNIVALIRDHRTAAT
jgi:hypothetical protein